MNDYVEQRTRIASWMCALGFAVLALVAARAAPADDASCVPVFDAISRLVKTPNHQYLTQSSDAPGSTPKAGEMIFTGKTTYFRVVNVWSSPTTIDYRQEYSTDLVNWTKTATGHEVKVSSN